MGTQINLLRGLLREEGREDEWEEIREHLERGSFNNLPCLPKALHMVFNRAHYYARLTGQAFEDLVQEGLTACLEAKLTHDPYKGSLITWQWWQIERRLKNYCNQTKRMLYSDDPLEPTAGPDPNSFHEMMEDAPPDVLFVCAFILDYPEQYGGLDGTCSRRKLKRLLTENTDWTPGRIHEAILDAKVWFRRTQAPMRRTA